MSLRCRALAVASLTQARTVEMGNEEERGIVEVKERVEGLEDVQFIG